MTSSGDVVELSEDNSSGILSAMNTMTCTGLRCLGVGYRIYSESEIPFINGII